MLLVLLLASWTTAAAAAAATTTFYVDPDAGADTNAGTAPDAAWATLAAASARVSALLDTAGGNNDVEVLLARGGIFLNDPLFLDSAAGVKFTGGIRVSAFGNISLPRPLLQHARGLASLGDTPCVSVQCPGAAQTIVSQLHLSGCGRGLRIAGNTATGAAATTNNVLVQDNIFSDIRTEFLRYAPPNPKWAPAILLDGGSFTNLTVTHNVAARIDVFFVNTGTISTMNLDGNTVQQCSGNCYSFGRGVGLTMRNSVMLRDVSTRLFSYGTTDVIVGGLEGANALLDNDFVQRGEYQGGPDGCAFDFETSATGFVVRGNAFSQSWGAGIMVFGHETTSHDLHINDNVFDRCGCIQNRGDRGGVAVMCPGGHKPSGQMSNNTFFVLPGCPAVKPAFDGCDADLVQTGNVVRAHNDDPASAAVGGIVTMPQLSYRPPSPDDTATQGLWNVIAVTYTPNATIRYTLDGSRPTETSPVMPANSGLDLPWPGPAVHVNVRAFKPGMVASMTNGALVELNYGFGRMAPGAAQLGPGGKPVGALGGKLEALEKNNDGNGSASTWSLSGWAVDTALPRGGWDPVTVTAFVDEAPVAAALASESRPDLVKAGVAPNPLHGFHVALPAAAAAQLLSAGRHTATVRVAGSPSAVVARALPETGVVVCVDGKCA